MFMTSEPSKLFMISISLNSVVCDFRNDHVGYVD